MRNTIILFLLFTTSTILSQNKDFFYKEYSYTELFNMINTEKNAVFKLKNAFIKYDLTIDTLFMASNTEILQREKKLIVDKELQFENVHFQNHVLTKKDNDAGYLSNIHFKKKVSIRNSASIAIINCEFDDILSFIGSGDFCNELETIKQNENINDYIKIENSVFNNGLKIFYNCNYQNNNSNTVISLEKNIFYPNKDEYIGTSLGLIGRKFGSYHIYENSFPIASFVNIDNNANGIILIDNNFKESIVSLSYENNSENGKFEISGNKFNKTIFLGIPELSQTNIISIKQFTKGFISIEAFQTAVESSYYSKIKDSIKNHFNAYTNKLFVQKYKNNAVFEIEKVFELEISFLGRLYDYYKSRHNNRSANKVYIRLKNLETERLAFEYQKKSTFKNYFSWKINQFLSIFSDYGTEPAKAIIFSVQVIILFALIYFFFPNSWDTLGRNRLMYRFEFFQKYLKRKDGIHTLYLEENKMEINSFQLFKKNLESSTLKLPIFFIKSAKLLYKISMLRTKLISRFLKSTDILKGTWSELSPNEKKWKGFQVGTLFVLSVLYDITIKLLNALMLSINTFTTLGFGDIPIKGLTRYLAIIEGFIGWFMLSIFSVSLISQLLG
ncbi:Ion channel [Polaribacter sp. Hel1_33_78]|uniref:potassium channel family protein n=1 Tax=unclassified Polaribacter TaxID=196858 RepID=UPI00087B25CF|nr:MULTISPECIES: potassium channel family protein [unclassified Polaribacter]MDG1196305.1 potassium channel family protein [Polaribacter sp.]MDG1402266.1 potassium channel family protein [Polaribacter sp.]SDU15115.1 Ion channel [Polaribacter sp. Hel1_33_78]